MIEFIVLDSETDLSLEQFLAQKIPAAPRAYLRQLIKKGKVGNASGPMTQEHITTPGETIHLPASQRLSELLTALPGVPDILYESRELLIVNKPAGLAVHSSQGHEKDNLVDRIRSFLKARGEQFTVAPIQRLDLETSGPVLFGKGTKSCSELGKVFMRGDVKKTYLALVQGRMQGRGTLISEIPAKEKLKTAATGYQVLAGHPSASLLEIELHTGRQHQIRRQLADLGHPLFGDRRYHGPCPQKLSRLFLHCRRLAFIDPFQKQLIDINCPLPDKLTRFLEHIDIQALPGH